jgi:hypothetical protein
MTHSLELQPAGEITSRQFMTAGEYREFSEQFQKEVKLDLDKQRDARIRSEEQAKKHLVG